MTKIIKKIIGVIILFSMFIAWLVAPVVLYGWSITIIATAIALDVVVVFRLASGWVFDEWED